MAVTPSAKLLPEGMPGQHPIAIQPQAAVCVLGMALSPAQLRRALPEPDQALPRHRYPLRKMSRELPRRRQTHLHPYLVHRVMQLRPNHRDFAVRVYPGSARRSTCIAMASKAVASSMYGSPPVTCWTWLRKYQAAKSKIAANAYMCTSSTVPNTCAYTIAR